MKNITKTKALPGEEWCLFYKNNIESFKTDNKELLKKAEAEVNLPPERLKKYKELLNERELEFFIDIKNLQMNYFNKGTIDVDSLNRRLNYIEILEKEMENKI